MTLMFVIDMFSVTESFLYVCT